jgi:ubiquinone/menaquinone biosynthesis C-methylase UbiE
MAGPDADYGGSIPDAYERCLVPMLFIPYASDIAERALARDHAHVIELAAGTGIAARALARALPTARIEATDLNERMIQLANIRWSVADAQDLPFDTGTFDLAVCQFGIMFFPERLRALREVSRVLGPKGTLLFNVWDDLDHNDVARTISQAAASKFTDNPLTFSRVFPTDTVT